MIGGGVSPAPLLNYEFSPELGKLNTKNKLYKKLTYYLNAEAYLMIISAFFDSQLSPNQVTAMIVEVCYALTKQK